MNENLVVLDPVVRRDGLQLPESARGLVVIAHLASSPQCSGHRFIADVLRANGLVPLLVSLHPPEEQHLGQPAPGQVLIKRRLRAVFDWLSTQQAQRPLPVALLAIDGAVRGCVAVATRHGPSALRTVILLDGRPYHFSNLLARLSQPTLLLAGAGDAAALPQYRSAMRQMGAPATVELLRMATQPKAAPGAHQAIAHAAMTWFDKTLVATPQAQAQSPVAFSPPSRIAALSQPSALPTDRLQSAAAR